MKKLLLLITGLLLLFSLEGQILRYSNYTAPEPPVEQEDWEILLDDGNTYAWYIADDEAAYITKDGSDLVSAWLDQSGNDRDLASTGDARPTWTSPDYILFDGTDDVLSLTITNTAQPIFFYAVINVVDGEDGGTLLRGASDSYCRIYQNGATGTSIRLYSGGVVTDGHSVGENAWFIGRWLFYSTGSTSQINNDAKVTGDAGTNGTNTSLNVGSGNSTYSNMGIKEYIIRTHADSDEESAIIYNYLKAKYSL